MNRGATRTPCLLVLTGPNAGHVFRISQPAIRLGRSRGCDFVVEDIGVSRVHAKIVHETDGSVVIRDACSSNGTFVNGQRVEQQALNDGDRIELGDAVMLKFRERDELEEAAHKLFLEFAVRDALTGTYNRRYFEEALAGAAQHAARNGTDLSVILFDIDDLKSINDTFGYQVGDEALRQVAARCSAQIRQGHLLCRVGGDEFAVIASDMPIDEAVRLAGGLRLFVSAEPLVCDGNDLKLTLSLGVACFQNGMREDVAAIVAAADRAVCRAKESGRDRVCAVETSEVELGGAST